jgi:hypothetical protein
MVGGLEMGPDVGHCEWLLPPMYLPRSLRVSAGVRMYCADFMLDEMR